MIYKQLDRRLRDKSCIGGKLTGRHGKCESCGNRIVERRVLWTVGGWELPNWQVKTAWIHEEPQTLCSLGPRAEAVPAGAARTG